MLSFLQACLLLDMSNWASLAVFGQPLTDYIRHYEPIYYDHHAFNAAHHRAKRSSSSADHLLHLNLKAHGKTFKIRLKRDQKVLANDVLVEDSNGQVDIDTHRAYIGHLEGEPGTYVHGVVTSEGLFEGKVVTADDQFVVERSAKYEQLTNETFHSVMYRHSDVHMDGLRQSVCNSDSLHKRLHEQLQQDEARRRRRRRSPQSPRHSPIDASRYEEALPHVLAPGREIRTRLSHHPRRRVIDPSKTTCTLYMQADHLFYEKYHRNIEVVIDQLTQHVQGVNEIYSAIDFDHDGGNDNINFIIKRIKVHTDSKAPNYKFPGNYGVETFLELFSEDNFDAFCLAYMFTNRDFDGGTLGLAWTGDLTNAGGVCERNGQFRGSLKSLNSGIVTVLNYKKDVPSTVSHVTMAHEMGHNMGSQHDPETDHCSPGGDHGNFIMFARATSGDKPNNNRFSDCSVESMSSVMEVKARSDSGCFIQETSSICGNGVVEDGEECDCGWDDECTDACCFPQTDRPGQRTPCKRRGSAICSPSEGPCCSSTCQLIGGSANFTCREATDCKEAGFCDGISPICPDSPNMPDKTICEGESVCFDGACSGSLCLAYNLEPCQCPPDQPGNFAHEDLCKLCCQIPNDKSTCSPSDALNRPPYDVPDLMVKSGAPCNDYLGYCDVFHECREANPSGPLSNFKLFFSSEGLESMKLWLLKHWYVVLLCSVGLLSIMAVLIRMCTPRRKSALPVNVPPPRKATPPPRVARPRLHSLKFAAETQRCMMKRSPDRAPSPVAPSPSSTFCARPFAPRGGRRSPSPGCPNPVVVNRHSPFAAAPSNCSSPASFAGYKRPSEGWV